MQAEVVNWAEVQPGSTVVVQGTLMKYLRDREEQDEGIPETRFIIVEFQGMEMEMGVFNEYLVAVILADAGDS
jgi:hypothetical protein